MIQRSTGRRRDKGRGSGERGGTVLLDLVKVELVEAAPRLPHEIIIPGRLFEDELIRLGRYHREELVALGIRVEDPDDTGYALAVDYTGRYRLLSENDCFALALAKANGWLLLTGDRRLRRAAGEQGVAVHGLLWLCDEMLRHATVAADTLLRALLAFERDPLVWLPQDELRARITRLRHLVQGS